MKTNIFNPIAAAAVFTLTMFGCSSSDTQRGTTAMNTSNWSTTESVVGTEQTIGSESLAVTEPADRNFEMQYEAETRSGGLVLRDDVAYGDMFEDLGSTKSYNLATLAGTSSNLSTFMELLRSTDMMSALEAEGSYTLFAPTNQAFANLPAGQLEHLMKPENKTELVELINAHILPSKVRAGQFNSSQQITLGDGRIIPISVDQTSITVGGATVVKQNVEASNGIIHVVDAVITPSEDASGTYSPYRR